MHSLLKSEFPRLSSLSSHICKNKGKAGGSTADQESGLVLLSAVKRSPKQEHSHDAQLLLVFSGAACCLQERDRLMESDTIN
jgi:hypothetical protein